jgi:hypothetical protein
MPGKGMPASWTNGEKLKCIKVDPQLLFELVFPYLDDVVIGVECVFCRYWVADLCAEHHIQFVLAHALYMKAIRGGKTKNDEYRFVYDRFAVKRRQFPRSFSVSGQMGHQRSSGAYAQRQWASQIPGLQVGTSLQQGEGALQQGP